MAAAQVAAAGLVAAAVDAAYPVEMVLPGKATVAEMVLAVRARAMAAAAAVVAEQGGRVLMLPL